jgi:uncharacterized membrane protein YbhN (UPF0104 family)
MTDPKASLEIIDAANLPPQGKKNSRLQRWVITLLKIIIAVAGIWFVVMKVTWGDAAVLATGEPGINGYVFLEETPVAVVGQTTVPGPGGGVKHLVRIRLPDKPVKVRVDTPDGPKDVELRLKEGEIIPGTQERVTLPAELDVSEDRLADIKGEKVQEGMKSLLIRASAKWYLLLAAWALLGIPFFVTAIRWRGLMRPQGIQMPLGKCLQLTFVGQFYSIMLPSLTGGDLVKIVYAARLTGSKTKSFITIILDRVIGLVALMAIASTSAGVQLALNKSRGDPIDNTLLNVFVMILALLVALAAGATVYFSRRLRRLVGIEWFVEHFGANDDPKVQHEKMEHLFRVVNLIVLIAAGALVALLASLRWAVHLHWARHNTLVVYAALIILAGAMAIAAAGLILHELVVKKMAPLLKRAVESLVRVDETLHVYRGHFGLLVWAFAISLLSQLTLPLSAWLSGSALGMTAPLTHYLAYVPVAVLAASLPVSPPQGFGVMDYVLVHVFAEQGKARAGQAFALAQAVRFLPILWNLFGAYWVVTGSYSRRETENEEKALAPES